jgi:hypothetical protein
MSQPERLKMLDWYHQAMGLGVRHLQEFTGTLTYQSSRRTTRSTRAANWADFEIIGSWPRPGHLGRLAVKVRWTISLFGDKQRFAGLRSILGTGT